MPNPRRSSFVASTPKLAVTLVSCLLGLLTVELYLRITDYSPLADLRNGREAILRPSSFKSRQYELVPNAAGRAWGTDVRINSSGFRDDEYSERKPEGVRRIVVVGDSITFGNDLPFEQVYPQRLEELLTDSPPTEVLNLGVGGYNLLQEVDTLEEIGLRFDPDLVVVGFCLNDIIDTSPNLEYIRRLARYRSSPLYGLRLAQLVRARADRAEQRRVLVRRDDEEVFLQHNRDYLAEIGAADPTLELAARLREFLASYRGPRLHRALPKYASRPHLGKLRYSFEQLARLQVEHGFGVVVIVFPFLLEEAETAHAYRLAVEIAATEAARVGFEVLDPYPELSRDGLDLVRRPRDGIHLNARGHERIASRIYEYLRKRPE